LVTAIAYVTRTALLALSLGLATACTDAALWLANQPVSVEKSRDDVAYGPESRQRLDWYGEAEDRPLIAFFYGGGWTFGDKSDYAFVADTLVKRGYQVAVIDYRLSPEVAFPVFVEDSKLALHWLRKQTDVPLIAMGHSAGAYNALMAVAQGAPADLAIGLAGPYAFIPKEEKYKRIFASADPIAEMHVGTYVTHNMPTTLLLHGTDDTTVMPLNTTKLADALDSNTIPNRVIFYPDTGHYGIMRPFAAFGLSDSPLVDDIDQFIQTHVGDARDAAAHIPRPDPARPQ